MKKIACLLTLIVLLINLSIYSQENIIYSPEVKLQSNNNLRIQSIKLGDKYTEVLLRYRTGHSSSNIKTALPGSSNAFYIADEYGNRVAELYNVKNISDKSIQIKSNSYFDFLLIFTALDTTLKTVDIIEGTADPSNWCFYGVELSNSGGIGINKEVRPSDERNANYTLKGTGTGFLVSTEGYVATNYHVIKGSDKIRLLFERDLVKSMYEAIVVLYDKTNDIAILKIIDKDFPKLDTIPYRISTEYEVGENVFTIGYPHIFEMGIEPKLTTGIINSLSGIEDDNTYMQISTQIQPGNSGGPLFNKNGDVIGITTLRLGDLYMINKSGSIPQNVNYAIKSDYLTVLCKNFSTPSTGSLAGMELKEQTKILRNYTCIIANYIEN